MNAIKYSGARITNAEPFSPCLCRPPLPSWNGIRKSNCLEMVLQLLLERLRGAIATVSHVKHGSGLYKIEYRKPSLVSSALMYTHDLSPRFRSVIASQHHRSRGHHCDSTYTSMARVSVGP